MTSLRLSGIFVLAILAWNGVRACTREELQMVQIISLHGATSPPSTYPQDPNPPTVWSEGLSDLTMLGKFQSYALGIFLRNFYEDFITSDPREIEVVSSADKHTVKSAQSLATALYIPTPFWEVVQNFSWQPIYIKYDSDDNKFLSKRMCPAADAEYKRSIFSETGLLLQSYQNLFLFWSMNSGMDLKNVDDVEELYHILETEFAHNLTIPDWSKKYWNEMKYLHDVSILLRVKSAKLRRLLGGLIVGRTIEKMQEKAANELDPKKVVLYSTHTYPMMGFLAGMDFGNFERPPPCATVLAELYKHEGEYFVRYLYLNSTSPQREPQEVFTLTVNGCTEFCPLEYVVEYTRDVVPGNWEQECLQM